MIKEFIKKCKSCENETKIIMVYFIIFILFIILAVYLSAKEISQDDCKDLCESLGLVAQDYAPSHACFCCNHTIITVNNQKFIESNDNCKLYIKYGDRK